jgi:hypothetical protein
MLSVYGLQELKKNPLRIHQCIRMRKGYPALLMWVKENSVKYNRELIVEPKDKYESNIWSILAGVMIGGVKQATQQHPYTANIPKGLFEMCAHFRSATYMFVRSAGVKTIRSGSIVRIDKLNETDQRVFQKIVDLYNDDVRKKAIKEGSKFQPIIQWLREHPEAMALWEESKALREQ